VFHPAADGIEPIRGRLPDTGLLAWADLPTTILAPDRATAASVALEVATATWPAESRGRAPFATGTSEQD
jgi:hypothetical protein